jgi:DUF3102 family protein
MTTTITTKNGQQLARPLKVLVPLIKRDIENAEHAGKMFYIAAGGKLMEARDQINHGEWRQWLNDNFYLSYDTARIWMGWWEAENVRGEEFQTSSEFRKRYHPAGSKPKRNVREYDAPVDRILSGINAKEMRERAVTAAKEYELERKLANQLIKIGYGVLATKFHPDKGGSVDAMRRLNKVTKALRQVYS